MTNSGDKIIRSQVSNVQVTFDKEAAWMRLQDRMESKDEKKGFFGIGWVAAAVLLLGCMLWYGLSGTKENTVAKEQKEIKNIAPVATPDEPIKEEQRIAVTEKVIAPPVENKMVIIIEKQKTVVPNKVKVIVPVYETIEPVIAKEEQPINNAPQIAVAPKPKLEVIHINTVVEEEKRERAMRNSRYAGEKINYDEFFEDPMMPKNPFKIYISRQN